MRASNRTVLTILPLVAVALAFWLLALSPKRQEASDLEADVAALQAQVEEQEQLAAGAEAARRNFPSAYRRVVVMGKAAPEDDDTSSLLVQLNRIAEETDVRFVALENEGESTSAPAAAPAAPAPEAPASGGEAQPVASETEGTPAPATEATVALLPIGASVGPAGLPVMKYSLTFEGDFFHLADYLAGLDEMVRSRDDGSVGVRGRLITVDGFELVPIEGVSGVEKNPDLTASLNITTFVTPADEGLTAGASPTGPAPATEPQPASTAPAAEPTATASTATP